MSDEKPKRMSKEAVAWACHDWDDDDQRTVRAEALRARASEKRLADLLRQAQDVIGMNGYGDDADLFYCETCRNAHRDWTKIDHSATCLVTRARAALSEVES